jgi:hypothetical protein
MLATETSLLHIIKPILVMEYDRRKRGGEEAAGADVECIVRILQTYEKYKLSKKVKGEKGRRYKIMNNYA